MTQLGEGAALGVALLVGVIGLLSCTATVKAGRASSPVDNAPGASPRLVIEAGGHQATIRELLFTADGRELISVSDDKTMRVWTVSPDGRHATLARALRGQIGDNREGQLAAAALSPPDAAGKQRWLAVGGFLAGPPDARHAVRLHAYASGEVHALLDGHTDLVLALAFSPSGRWLASAGKDNTIRIWDMASLQGKRLTKAPVVLPGHTDHIYDLAWSAMDSRLASASFDHTVGLWKTEHLAQDRVTLLKRLRGHSRQVRTVTFHPNRAVLASGGKDGTVRLWHAKTGKSLGIFASTGNQVAALAFSPDGRLLLSGRTGGDDEPRRVTLYAYPSGRKRRVFTKHDNIVLATAFHPSGQWVASGGGNQKEILLWDVATGEVLSRLAGGGRTIWAVGFAKDGRSISWGQTSKDAAGLARAPLEYHFDLKDLALKSGLPAAAVIEERDRVGTLQLTTEAGGPHNYPFRLHIFSGSRRLTTLERGPDNGYRHSAYTLTPDGVHILSGGLNGVLTLYTLDGTIRATFVGHTGEIKAVAVSADGQWAVSGASDQTLSLWSLAGLPATGSTDIAPTLTLVPFVDGEWVAWIPEGFFEASSKGAQLIGYSLNQGLDKMARYVSIDQLYEPFYRPDLVLEKLQGDPKGVLEREGRRLDLRIILAGGPAPQVTFLEPAADTTVAQRDFTVRVALTDQGGGIGRVVWKINGIISGPADSRRPSSLHNAENGPDQSTASPPIIDPDAFSIVFTKQLTLVPRENTLEVVAYNERNKVASPAAVRIVRLSIPSPPPALHVLTIGIDEYRHRSLGLRYAVSDAQAIGTMLQNMGGPMFRDVIVTTLFDGQATHNKSSCNASTSHTRTIPEEALPSGIAQAFTEVAARAEAQDVFVLYLAGHGIALDGKYHFLPQNIPTPNETVIRQCAVTQDDLQRWLARIDAQWSLVLLDTCASGTFPHVPKEMQNIREKTAIARLLQATGRAFIAATTAEGVALEGYKGHGIFTSVLLEALQRADQRNGDRDGKIHTYEVAAYVDARVPTLSRKIFGVEQIPHIYMQGRNFPIGVVP